VWLDPFFGTYSTGAGPATTSFFPKAAEIMANISFDFYAERLRQLLSAIYGLDFSLVMPTEHLA
jgi:hypothetical protein